MADPRHTRSGTTTHTYRYSILIDHGLAQRRNSCLRPAMLKAKRNGSEPGIYRVPQSLKGKHDIIVLTRSGGLPGHPNSIQFNSIQFY